MHRFNGKVALITGAAHASRAELMGVGGATAWLLAGEGGHIVITDIDDDLGEHAAAEMRDAGHDVIYANLDVTDESAWQRVVKAVSDRFGTLDTLVNIAGLQERHSVHDTPLDEWKRVMEVSSTGVFLGMKAVIEPMRNSGGGSIVNISSIAARGGGSYGSSYFMSRGGIVAYSRAASVQLARHRIRVNCILPGWTLTPFTQHLYRSEVERESRLARVPLGRWGRSEDIANAILYFASDESSYVTGAELVVDGGTTAQL